MIISWFLRWCRSLSLHSISHIKLSQGASNGGTLRIQLVPVSLLVGFPNGPEVSFNAELLCVPSPFPSCPATGKRVLVPAGVSLPKMRSLTHFLWVRRRLQVPVFFFGGFTREPWRTGGFPRRLSLTRPPQVGYCSGGLRQTKVHTKHPGHGLSGRVLKRVGAWNLRGFHCHAARASLSKALPLFTSWIGPAQKSLGILCAVNRTRL